jgi:microcystin-dependent protein
MDTPFVGQIELFGFNFAPRGWAFCNGQLLPISQNTALFSLLGTIYGGDGRTTFALPDLRGRCAVGEGTGPGLPNYRTGQTLGTVDVTLLQTQMPSHSHNLMAVSSSGDSNDPSGKVLAAGSVTVERGGSAIPVNGYASGAANTAMGASISNSGGNQSHNNMQPSIALNYCIALVGIYPSRN